MIRSPKAINQDKIVQAIYDGKEPVVRLACLRCLRSWNTPLYAKIPKHCPHCKNPSWLNREKFGTTKFCHRCGHSWVARTKQTKASPFPKPRCPSCRTLYFSDDATNRFKWRKHTHAMEAKLSRNNLKFKNREIRFKTCLKLIEKYYHYRAVAQHEGRLLDFNINTM